MRREGEDNDDYDYFLKLKICSLLIWLIKNSVSRTDFNQVKYWQKKSKL